MAPWTGAMIGRIGTVHCPLDARKLVGTAIRKAMLKNPINSHLTKTVTLTSRATSRINLTPQSKSGKTKDAYFLMGGTGRIFNVTSVTTPKVPADNNIKLLTTLWLNEFKINTLRSKHHVVHIGSR